MKVEIIDGKLLKLIPENWELKELKQLEIGIIKQIMLKRGLHYSAGNEEGLYLSFNAKVD